METETFSKLPHKIYHEVVDKIVKLHNLDDSSKFKIEYSAGSAKGDNYLGIMFRIQIKSKEDNSTKLSLIAKLPPQNENRREECLAEESFHREIEFYDILMPIYKKFQKKKSVQIFTEFPNVFSILSKPPHEAIFFEDLKMRNFEMFDRFKDFTKEHIILVLKALAKMHAIFFCIKDQEPEVVKQFIGREDYVLFIIRSDKPMLNAWYECQKKLALTVLEKIKNDDIKEKIECFLNGDMKEILKSIIGINVAEPYSTICHGDIWNNNIMFKNDQNGIPIDVSLLDFQLIRYSSPVIDVMHFIFTSTTKELRDKHYQEFLDIYYETLSTSIRSLNSDPNKLFPRHIFGEHLKKFGKFGLYIAVMFLPIITTNKEDTPDLDEISDKTKNTENSENPSIDFKPSERYEKRILGVFEDICNLGYI
ncbi:hypothetical protein PVAND_000511 [Polypedilum vanderplanki]|uniref:CHK kinase-like domain-containing protein n=1 Tax=Polypedilum vanderplanki TaxID=319348 RepID=A0A9J6BKF4_POLVA|nr:hypothetical protein PVAND_000511 [Polypedilum vanderplanki]